MIKKDFVPTYWRFGGCEGRRLYHLLTSRVPTPLGTALPSYHSISPVHTPVHTYPASASSIGASGASSSSGTPHFPAGPGDAIWDRLEWTLDQVLSVLSQEHGSGLLPGLAMLLGLTRTSHANHTGPAPGSTTNEMLGFAAAPDQHLSLSLHDGAAHSSAEGSSYEGNYNGSSSVRSAQNAIYDTYEEAELRYGEFRARGSTGSQQFYAQRHLMDISRAVAGLGGVAETVLRGALGLRAHSTAALAGTSSVLAQY